MWTSTILNPKWAPDITLFNTLGWFLSQYMHVLLNTLLTTQRDHLKISSVLSLWSSLRTFVLWILAAFSVWTLSLISSTQRIYRPIFQFPLPVLETLSMQLRESYCLPCLFPVSQGPLSFVAWHQCLENCSFMYFVWHFCLFQKER